MAEEGAVFCPCCNKSSAQFLPMGPAGRQRLNAKCPHCASLERHRLLILFFGKQPKLFERTKRLLHIAPEAPIASWIKSFSDIDYVSGDIADPRAMYKVDLMDVQFPTASFDAVICNHVLEHVPDDRKALSEIQRILRPNGWAILMVPIHPALKQTREDPSVTDPKERERLFGQSDHLRWYGADYEERLSGAHFAVDVIPFARTLNDVDRRKFGLQAAENIYLCRKPLSP
jgi:SAM-dependent methyltransferase